MLFLKNLLFNKRQKNNTMKFLIVGLGNPGAKYAHTRHNIGFEILDDLAIEEGVVFVSDRYADISRFKARGKQFVMIKPSTYMNNSGKAVNYWMQKEKINSNNLLVVLDDVALDQGVIRIKPQGSAGGHNGLSDIISTLKTTAVPRLRFGIGNNYAKGYQVEYVLSRWSSEEKEALVTRIKLAGQAIKHFAFHGLNNTMNEFNNK